MKIIAIQLILERLPQFEQFALASALNALKLLSFNPIFMDVCDQKFLVEDCVIRDDFNGFRYLLSAGCDDRAFHSILPLCARFTKTSFVQYLIKSKRISWFENDLSLVCSLDSVEVIKEFMKQFPSSKQYCATIPWTTLSVETVKYLMTENLFNLSFEALSYASDIGLLELFREEIACSASNVLTISEEHFDWFMKNGISINKYSSFYLAFKSNNEDLMSKIIRQSQFVCKYVLFLLDQFAFPLLRKLNLWSLWNSKCTCLDCHKSKIICNTLAKASEQDLLSGESWITFPNLPVDPSILLYRNPTVEMAEKLQKIFGSFPFDLDGIENAELFVFFAKQNRKGFCAHDLLHKCLESNDLEYASVIMQEVDAEMNDCCLLRCQSSEALNLINFRNASLSHLLTSKNKIHFDYSLSKLASITKLEWIRIFSTQDWKYRVGELQKKWKMPRIIDDFLQLKNIVKKPSLKVIKYLIEKEKQEPMSTSIQVAMKRQTSEIINYLLKQYFNQIDINDDLWASFHERGLNTESEAKGLDASLKKNTSFVKKLKSISEDQKSSIIKEFEGLKLSKYLTEAAASVLENKFKLSDIGAAAEVCSAIYQRYPEFGALLEDGLEKCLHAEKEKEEEKFIARVGRQKGFFKLLLEFYLVDIIHDKRIILRIFRNLLSIEESSQRGLSMPFLTILLKGYSADFLPCEQVPSNDFVGDDFRMEMLSIITGYYKKLSSYFVDFHSRMKRMEDRHREFYNTKGDLSEAQQSNYEKVVSNFDKLQSSVKMLAEYLKEEMPELPEEEKVTRIEGAIVFADKNLQKEKESGIILAFESEDERAFYEDIFDLKLSVPAALLGRKQEDVKDEEASEEVKVDAKVVEKEDKMDDKQKDKMDDKLEDKMDDNQEDKIDGKQIETKSKKEEEKRNTPLEEFLNNLPNLLSRELVDKAAVEFCYLNTKSARKRLVKALLTIPKNRLEVIPYYGRLIATLQKCFPDISTAINDELESEFKNFVRKKDNRNMEARIKIVKYIGELTKFQVFPQGITFMCLKTFIDDFQSFSIDGACVLLETCGRYLYHTPETHQRILIQLEIMNKKKGAMNLESRQLMMIENSYYLCNPPDKPKIERKVRDPLQEYANYLLYVELSKMSVEKVLKQLRKFDWKDKKIYDFLLKKFCKVWKIKYSNIHLLAMISSALAKKIDGFGVDLIDELLEDVRTSLEQNNFRDNQKRLAIVKFLGELYNCRLFDEDVLFDLLYLIVSFGHEQGFPMPDKTCPLDPPEDFFRIRLVCHILFTVGPYLVNDTIRSHLDKFLLFFQYYLQTKTRPSLDVEFMVTDLFEELFYHFKRERDIDVCVEKLMVAMKENTPIVVSRSERPEIPLEPLESPPAESVTDSESLSVQDQESSSDEDVSSPIFDEEFDKELSKLISSSIESRKLDKKTQIDMPLPFGLSSGSNASDSFTLLLKKKKKPKAKEVSLPSDFAHKVYQQQEADKEEQQEINKLVLKYESKTAKKSNTVNQKFFFGSASRFMNNK